MCDLIAQPAQPWQQHLELIATQGILAAAAASQCSWVLAASRGGPCGAADLEQALVLCARLACCQPGRSSDFEFKPTAVPDSSAHAALPTQFAQYIDIC